MSKYCRLVIRLCAVSLLLVFAFTPSACKKVDNNSAANRTARLKVVTSLYPIYDFARNIGKERVEVILLMPPGIEPHSFEPKPADVVMLNNADLFIFTLVRMDFHRAKRHQTYQNPYRVVPDYFRGFPFRRSGIHAFHHPSGH